jgi:hypothetical protein
MFIRRFFFAVLLAASLCGPAAAHKPSDAYLALSAEGGRMTGQWDIALRDLDFAIGLDADSDGAITWGETRAREEEVAAYALARLSIEADGGACALSAGRLLVDRHSDGAYAALPFIADCPAGHRLTIAYRLFADIDPQHRGLLRLAAGETTQTAVFGPDTARQSFDLDRAGLWRQLADHAADGVEHIWRGYDHILFLLSLLLPAVLLRRGGSWAPQPSFRAALIDVIRIVTAFTLAHSVTLALASLKIVELPARLSESAIAVSVIVAALNNIFPLIEGRRWMVAGGFGLLHGFGFAAVLTDLGLPPGAMTVALFGFNIGVEIGQLAIVSVFLPLAWALRGAAAYRQAGVIGGSCLIAGLAAVWLVERAFDMSLLPA